MKRINNISKLAALVIIVLSITFSSCRKNFEEINTNPHGFTSASDGALFNSVIESLKLGWNEQFYIHNEVLYKQTQLAALGNEAWGNISLGTEEIWSNYYEALTNIRELEKRLDEKEQSPEVLNMKAMIKVLLAYKTFKMTDLFGEIPFFDAGKGFQSLDNLRVPFDSQKDIYLFLLDELKWVEENIDENSVSEEPFLTFKNFDKLFSGNMLMWRKLANSLRLRYAMRMVNKELITSAEIIGDIIENELPVFIGYSLTSYVGEYAGIKPIDLGFINDAKPWSFREHKNLRMGSNIWRMMSLNDNTDGSGIFDVRAFCFFETNNAGEWAPYPQIAGTGTPAIGGMPYQNHRDDAYEFKGADCIYSPFSYFLVGEKNFVPELLITGAEVHFIKSEAYLRGIGVPADQSMASNEYMNGIQSSATWWHNTMKATSIIGSSSTANFEDKIIIPSSVSIISLINNTGMWNATTDDERLELIYTQRWIDAFRQPWEAFALARRTMKTPREGDALTYFRLPIPPSETEFNMTNYINTYSGTSATAKLWWME